MLRPLLRAFRRWRAHRARRHLLTAMTISRKNLRRRLAKMRKEMNS